MPSDIEGLVILGPTAAGKTEVGVEMAEMLGGEIINCDSMQVYRGMDIGTAKPTVEQQKRVRFHVIDITNPTEYYSAASFQNDARMALHDIRARGKFPIVVGGTGLYLRAFLEGFLIPPGPKDSEFRDALKQMASELGSHVLHERLKSVDPSTAARLSSNDSVRIIRALEVHHVTGMPMSSQQRKTPLALKVVKFGLTLDRQVLYRRIEARVDQMIAAGWQDETRRLLAAGCSPETPAMKSLGYKRLVDFICGKAGDFGSTIDLIKQDTRRFAKRQMTWFRKEADVSWIDVSAGSSRIASRIADAVLH